MRDTDARSTASHSSMKFLCLAYEDQSYFDELPAAEWRALRDETLAYVESLRASGTLLDTLPLRSARMAATLRVREGRTIVTDGPFTETKEQIGGYFLIEARDREEALRIAAGWPSARIGTIEVRPMADGLPLEGRYT